MLYFGGIVLYFGIGLLIAGMSMRVWAMHDSLSIPARLLFPWNSHDDCVGYPTGYSICGVMRDTGRTPLYAILMAVGWPAKVALCLAVIIYLRFFHS